MHDTEIGDDAGLRKRLPSLGRRRESAGRWRAEHQAGFFVGLADGGERVGRRFGKARPLHPPHQALDVARVQRRGHRHQPVLDLDPAAGKNKFAWQKAMPLVAASEQDFRHRSGAIDQDQGRGIARSQIGRGLIANRARKPLGAVVHRAASDHRFGIVFHRFLPLCPDFSRPDDRFPPGAIVRCSFGLCRVRSALPACAACSSRKRSAPATGAASTNSTGHRIAQPVCRRSAGEGAAFFVEVEILIADEAGGYQAVGAGFVKLDEQAGARDAGNVAVEDRRRRGPPGNARSAGRRSRARLSWRGARWPKCWRRLQQARAARSLRAVRQVRASARGSARDARQDRHSGGSAM